MPFTTKIEDIEFYNGPIKKLPYFCLEPENEDEVRTLLDLSSNWMKLFNTASDLDLDTLRKILYVEMCGRKRPDVVDRTRALIDTRFRNRHKEEVDKTFEEIQEAVK